MFSLESFKEEYRNFLKGRYSKMSEGSKYLIRNYYKSNSNEFSYIETYLYPSKYYEVYAKLLDVDINLLKDVSELCDRYDEEKEILKEYKLVDAVSERQELNKRQLDVQKELIDLEARSRQFLPEELAFRKELVQIEFQRAEAVKAIQAMQIPQEEKNKLIEKENELSFKALDIARQRLAVEKARRQGGFMEGVQQGFTDWVQKLPTELERGQQAFSSVMDSMNAALERFVRTGKLSFRDLIRDMIQNLLLLQMKAQMNSLFSSLLGGIFKTGSVYGPGEPNQINPGFGGAYADGGSPPVNRASIVGERGPELFVPRTAGTIIPNSAMGMMGNTTNVTNNYINAIDTKSFEDRLFGSSRAIWAANNYANKSLAVGTGRM